MYEMSLALTVYPFTSLVYTIASYRLSKVKRCKLEIYCRILVNAGFLSRAGFVVNSLKIYIYGLGRKKP